MLLDTASLYFRAFYGIPESVRAPDGSPVNAVRGLLDFTARLITDYRPDRLVACLDDDWRPEFRVRLLPSYKAHRVAEDGAEEVPDALTPQVDVIFQVFDAIGLARIGAPGYEADDVIGTLATRASVAGSPVDIVTGDRDLFQLVDDAAGTRVIYTAKGVAGANLVDEAAVTRPLQDPWPGVRRLRDPARRCERWSTRGRRHRREDGRRPDQPLRVAGRAAGGARRRRHRDRVGAAPQAGGRPGLSHGRAHGRQGRAGRAGGRPR